ncbi:hypothetical protein A7985_06425 [Pseudoalteromonas luteoviolacea]|uniref:Uncharacterized protein n=1 Tax=Pseudoalteromonas luteoviolacea TaxID=43657 RepID=A0A1C0TW80_9GAMM|nr:hypothetical protein [Pseudoalteromonas luteoviolacea]OCQ23573.1 hypothetical protein A7985_06425 [Pseudoalteromonas luteoviolacea]
MKKSKLSLGITLALCLSSTQAFSQELVSDGQFSAPSLQEAQTSSESTHWQVSSIDDAGIFNPTSSQYLSHDTINNIGFVNAGAKLSQSLHTALDMQSTYTISAKVGWRNDSDAYNLKLVLGLMANS